MEITRINSTAAPQPVGSYAQAVEVRGVRRMLFVSGQIPESLSGEVPADFRGQARLVWANVLAQLSEAGMTAGNIVKVTTFLSDRTHAATNTEVREEILGVHEPALTVIVAGIFDERWLVEIEVVAAD